MHRLLVQQPARSDLHAAFEWYLARSPVAASRFLEAVDDAIAGIEVAPERYPVIRGRLRRVLLSRFPYAVYYKIYPGTISIVGVLHGHRHPEAWLRRE